MVSFLYFNGSKIKDGRSPATPGITFDAPTATFHQDNAYTDLPLHGLWKIADDRVIELEHVLSGKYAYYNTGFVARRRWAAGHAGGPELHDRPVVRVVQPEPQRASAADGNVDAHSFIDRHGRDRTMSSTASDSGPIDAVDRHAVARQRHPRDRELADRPPRAGVPPGQRRQSRELPRLLHRRHDSPWAG